MMPLNIGNKQEVLSGSFNHCWGTNRFGVAVSRRTSMLKFSIVRDLSGLT